MIDEIRQQDPSMEDAVVLVVLMSCYCVVVVVCYLSYPVIGFVGALWDILML